MLNWQSPGSEGETSAPVSLANQHQLKCKRRKYCLPHTGSIVLLGKLWPRLWPKQLLYRIYWDYNSYRDIWPCKWVQTICQAICHLEECHFANAGRRHYRFFLAVCATVVQGLRQCCSASLLVSPCAPGWGTRNCKDQQDIWFSTCITLKSQAPVWFWLWFCLIRWELTKGMGALDTPCKEKSLAELHPRSSVSCMKGRHSPVQQRDILPTESRSERWTAVFKHWMNGCNQNFVT